MAVGLLLSSGPPVEGATHGPRVSFGLSGTGDASISVPLPETVEWQQFQPGAGLEARVTDPDAATRGNVVPRDDVTWRWYRGNTPVSGVTDRPNNYEVVAADVGHRIRLVATWRVRQSYDENDDGYEVFGPRRTASYTAPNPVQRYRDPRVNRVPAFPSATVTFSVNEHGRTTIGGPVISTIGEPVTATDPDGDILTYTVRGPDASISFGVPRFAIDNRTGQLRLAPGVELDYETRSSYTVQIRAYDSSANNTGAETDPQVTVDITVTINVINVGNDPLPVDNSVQPVRASQRTPDGGSASEGYCYLGAGNGTTEYVRYPNGRIAEVTGHSASIRSLFAC